MQVAALLPKLVQIYQGAMQSNSDLNVVDASIRQTLPNLPPELLEHSKQLAMQAIQQQQAQQQQRAAKAVETIATQPTQSGITPTPPASAELQTAPPGNIQATPATNPVHKPIRSEVSDPETFTETIRPASRLDGIGELMAEAYRNRNLSVTYEDACDKGIRCNKFIFKKPPSLEFSKLENYKEVLSHAGFDPLAQVIFRPLPNDRFELHIPRPRDQWRVSNLLCYFKGYNEALKHWKAGRYQAFFDTLRKGENVHPGDDLKALHSVDLNGNPIYLDLTTGVIVVGAPKMGKSISMETVLTYLCLAYPPEWLRAYLIDFKDGKTFGKFSVFPHVQEILTNHNTPSPQDLIDFFEERRRERSEIGKKIAAAGLSNIQQYNRKFPDNPIPWTVIFSDEVAVIKRFMNSPLEEDGKRTNAADETYYEGLSLWRSDGITFVSGTQYSNANLAFDPATRMCHGSGIAHRCSATGAAMAFSEDGSDEWIKMCPKLFPAGDCIVKNDGEFTRGQALWLNPEQQEMLLYAAERVYGDRSTPTVAGLPPITQSLPQSSPQTPKLAEADQVPKLSETDRRAWERIQAVLKRPDRSVNKLIDAAFGNGKAKSFSTYKPELVNLLHRIGQSQLADAVEKGDVRNVA